MEWNGCIRMFSQSRINRFWNSRNFHFQPSTLAIIIPIPIEHLMYRVKVHCGHVNEVKFFQQIVQLWFDKERIPFLPSHSTFSLIQTHLQFEAGWFGRGKTRKDAEFFNGRIFAVGVGVSILPLVHLPLPPPATVLADRLEPTNKKNSFFSLS